MLRLVKSNEPQTTLTKPVTIRGYGLTSGNICAIICKPAGAGKGIKFLVGRLEIPALWKNFDEGELDHTTTLIRNKVRIKTVEHLLSALWGLDIDNATLELEGGEVPLVDGSAQGYVAYLLAGGISKLPAKRTYIEIVRDVRFTMPGDDRWGLVTPAKSLSIESTSEFPNILGKKTVTYIHSPSNYRRYISWSRTFLRSPLDDKGEIWQDVRLKFPLLPKDPKKSPIIVYSNKEFITPLHSEDEPARHKVLDFIGDIAPLGYRIKGKFKLYKPGHRFTRKIVKELAIQADL